MVAQIKAALEIATDPAAGWSRLTDWPAHGRWLPLTEVRMDPSGPASGVGARFVGRTSLGPVGFDDPMVVVEWQPPDGASAGRCRLIKQGRRVTGWAEITVSARPRGSEVVWTEQISVCGIPSFADSLIGWIGSRLFLRTLRKMAAEIQ